MPRPVCEKENKYGASNNPKRSTYSESAIPTAGAKSHSVNAYAQTADPVFMACQHANSLSLQCIPNVACPIVIAAEQDTT